ncbi:18547_t:CDS:1, partial [Racocetra fulgida]
TRPLSHAIIPELADRNPPTQKVVKQDRTNRAATTKYGSKIA